MSDDLIVRLRLRNRAMTGPPRLCNEWVTVATAAARLNVSPAVVRKWAQRHKDRLKPNTRGEYWFATLVEIEHATRHGKGARRKLTTVP